jgi:hypothetical protein
MARAKRSIDAARVEKPSRTHSRGNRGDPDFVVRTLVSYLTIGLDPAKMVVCQGTVNQGTPPFKQKWWYAKGP